MSVCFYVYLSLCQSFYLYVYISKYFMYVCLYVYVCMFVYVCSGVDLHGGRHLQGPQSGAAMPACIVSVCMSVFISIHLTACLHVYLVNAGFYDDGDLQGPRGS